MAMSSLSGTQSTASQECKQKIQLAPEQQLVSSSACNNNVH